ncbi:class I SAM-dependent methyltransferase [Candidatus Woesearchaeota archaeon]|nr:class I SAM-dependent methyltransferase [Candidatus Woesearchaeota archaeon]
MDDKKFNQIESEYATFYRGLMKQGRFPTKDTGIGFWGPSITSEVYEVFKKLGLHKFKNFLDLGSGDGKVTLIASLFCKNAHGIEYDSELHNKALELQNKLKLKNVRFVNDDFMNYKISKHDIIFCSPDKPMERGLGKKLENELKGKLIVHGHHFHPANLKKTKSVKVKDTLFTVYSRKK